MAQSHLKRLTVALLLGVGMFPPGVQAAIKDVQRLGTPAAPMPAGTILLAQDEESYEEPAAEEPAAEEPAAEEEPVAEEEPAAEEAEAPAEEETAQEEEPAAEEPAEEAQESSGEAEEPAAEEDSADQAEESAGEAEPQDQSEESDQSGEGEGAEGEQADDADGQSDEADQAGEQSEDGAAQSDQAEEGEGQDEQSDQAGEQSGEDDQAGQAGEEGEEGAEGTDQAEESDGGSDEADQAGEQDGDTDQSDQAESPDAEDGDADQAGEQPDEDGDAATAEDETVEDPAADAAVAETLSEEADEPLVEDAPAEPEDADAVLADENLEDDGEAPADVAAEVEQAAQDAPDDADPAAFAEELPAGEDAPADEVAPLFDSVKDEPVEDVAPDEVSQAAPPTSDEESQAFEAPAELNAARFTDAAALESRPDVAAVESGSSVVYNENNTTIIQTSETTIVNSYASYQERFSSYGYSDVSYERYSGGYYSERAASRDGSYVFTTYDRWGNVVERRYRDRGGRDYVLAWYDVKRGPIRYADVGRGLPPLRPRFPASYYVLAYDRADANSVYRFLRKPPVEKARRLYSIDEVKRSPRLRDTLPRVEIGNLSFPTGSARISKADAAKLKPMAAAMLKQIRANPAESFLIEGHTDAVGSARDNLVLSDRRAQAVAQALSRFYRVPPQNLYTQGYGEQFLKVKTNGPSTVNRRVTVRRTTPLVTPVAAR